MVFLNWFRGWTQLASKDEEICIIIMRTINSILDDYEKWKMISINAITTAKNYDVTSMSKFFYKGLINATK